MGACFSRADADPATETVAYDAVGFKGEIREDFDGGTLRYATSDSATYVCRRAPNNQSSAAVLSEEARLLAVLGLRPAPIFFDKGCLHLLAGLPPGTVSLRSLLKTRGSAEPEKAAKVVRGLIETVAAIHAIGFYHGDVRPECFAVGHRGEIAVAAVRCDGPSRTLIEYQAPEVVNEFVKLDVKRGVPGPRGDEAKSADLWSLGATVYEVATGVVWGHVLADWKRRVDALDYVDMTTASLIRIAMWDILSISNEELLALAPFPRGGRRFEGILRKLLRARPQERELPADGAGVLCA